MAVRRIWRQQLYFFNYYELHIADILTIVSFQEFKNAIPKTIGKPTLSYGSESQIIRGTDERTLVSLRDIRLHRRRRSDKRPPNFINDKIYGTIPNKLEIK
jgi:hypothetical protein